MELVLEKSWLFGQEKRSRFSGRKAFSFNLSNILWKVQKFSRGSLRSLVRYILCEKVFSFSILQKKIPFFCVHGLQSCSWKKWVFLKILVPPTVWTKRLRCGKNKAQCYSQALLFKAPTKKLFAQRIFAHEKTNLDSIKRCKNVENQLIKYENLDETTGPFEHFLELASRQWNLRRLNFQWQHYTNH